MSTTVLAYVSLATQILITSISFMQTVIVYLLVKQLTKGTKYDIHVRKNGDDKGPL